MNGGTRRAAPAHQTRPAAARSLRRALTSRHSRGAGGRDQRRREAPDALSASAEPRPRPTGVAVQTRSRQPPPQRPSGGSAVPRRPGRVPLSAACSCRLLRAPWAGRRSRCAGTASSCRQRSATTAGPSSLSSAATKTPRARAGARTA